MDWELTLLSSYWLVSLTQVNILNILTSYSACYPNQMSVELASAWSFLCIWMCRSLESIMHTYLTGSSLLKGLSLSPLYLLKSPLSLPPSIVSLLSSLWNSSLSFSVSTYLSLFTLSPSPSVVILATSWAWLKACHNELPCLIWTPLVRAL